MPRLEQNMADSSDTCKCTGRSRMRAMVLNIAYEGCLIYQRIKKLEDKILELEGISPEYFQSISFSGKRRKVQPPQQNYSLAELDEKISALKQALLRKSREAESLATHHLP